MPPISAKQPRCWEGPPVIRIFVLGAKTIAVGGLVRVFHSKVHVRQFLRWNAGLPLQSLSALCTFQVSSAHPDAKSYLLLHSFFLSLLHSSFLYYFLIIFF